MHHLEIYEILRSKLNKAPVGVPKGLDDEEKGTVFKDKRGDGTVYRLLPVVIGWFETPFWPGLGKDSRQERLLRKQTEKDWFMWRKITPEGLMSFAIAVMIVICGSGQFMRLNIQTP